MPELSRRRPGDWILAGEALCGVVLAATALRLVRFDQIARWASARRRTPPLDARSQAAARRVAAAVAAAAHRAPWAGACFPQALACHLMLRRRGLPSRLYYGARNRGSLGPVAHVWVRSGDLGLTGADTAGQFALLAAFPPLRTADGGEGG